MTPAARLQAAIEILDEVIASVREDGPPADAIVTRYFKTRRYAGSKDRRAVRELVFRAIRRSASVPTAGGPRSLALPTMTATCRLVRRIAARAGTAWAMRGERRPSLIPGMASARSCRQLVTEANGPRCWSGRRWTSASMRREQAATRCWRQFDGAAADPPQPLGPPPSVRQPRRRPSRLFRRPGGGPGRGQPADRARLRAERRRTSSTSAPGRRQIARARGGRAEGRSSPPTPTGHGCRSWRRGQSGQGRASKRRLLNRGRELAQLADWKATATSCWSTRPAPAAAPGGATRRGGGG